MKYYLITTVSSWGDGYEKESPIPIAVTEEETLYEVVNEHLFNVWFDCDQIPDYAVDDPYVGYTFHGGAVRERLDRVLPVERGEYDILFQYI